LAGDLFFNPRLQKGAKVVHGVEIGSVCVREPGVNTRLIGASKVGALGDAFLGFKNAGGCPAGFAERVDCEGGRGFRGFRRILEEERS
jgi:hypothetical protein